MGLASQTLFRARDLSLIALSLIFLPFSVLLVGTALAFRLISVHKSPSAPPRRDGGRQLTVLVTGIGMAKGLFLARAFHLGGCRVIGADFEKNSVPACGRFSSAISRFYKLKISTPESYADQVAELVRNEHVDVWVSVSGVATAMEDAVAMRAVESLEAGCRCFQFDEDTTKMLDDKSQFMRQTERLGLVSAWYCDVKDKLQVNDIVMEVKRRREEGKEVGDKYMVKNVGMDDATRGGLPILSSSAPKQMATVLSSLDYTGGKSWILQEFIEGGEEYCTHSVVVDGQVKAFLACPSDSVLLHYQLLDANSALYKAMLRFTQYYAERMFQQQGKFTGHLSFDFLAQLKPTTTGVEKILKPIECNPRCHTATVHFRGSEVALVNAYLSQEQSTVVQSTKKTSYYWFAHDFVVLSVLPLLRTLIGQSDLDHAINSQLEYWRHIFLWKDPTFEWWDPMPWLALYHICWPMEMALTAWNDKSWYQINVSTMKIFAK